MALSDRDIIITPNRGAASEPTILFRGADATSSASINLKVYNSGTVGTLSFEGSSGQLLSITDSMSGSIFSVNDVSGIPSIEVFDTGEVRLAQYNGYVDILNSTPATSTNTGALQVVGGVGIGGNLYVGGTIYGIASVSGTISTATNIAGGAVRQIVYQTGVGTTGFITAPVTAGHVLTWNGGSFVWTVPGSANAVTITTTAQTTNAAHYLTFVDSNNASATAETVYTTSSFSINPATGAVGINGVGGTALNLSVPSSVIDRYFLNGTAAVNSFSIYDNSNTPYINSYASMAFRANQIGGTGGHFYFSGGNLMIGTGTPGAPLSFTDSLTTKIQLNANAANSYTIDKAAAVASGDSMFKFVAGATAAGEFGFYNTTNLRLLINNSGALILNGIPSGTGNFLVLRGGTGASAEGAHIVMGYGNNTSSALTGQGNNSWNVDVAGGVANNDFRIFRQNNAGATAVAINILESNAGVQVLSLGVGTAGSGTTGEIRATNEITAYYSSDIRLKENIRLIADPIGIINQIRGVYYDWTDDHIKARGGEDGYFVRKHDIGVIAQEVEKVLPEIVAERDDGTKVVKYEKIVALLIEAVKSQQQQINQILEQVENLANK